MRRAIPIFISLLSLSLLPSSARAESRVLTLDEALGLAATNQPQLRQARANTQAAQARHDGALAPLLPQISGNANYQRSTSNYAARPGSVPTDINTTGNSQWATSNFFNFGLSANQLIWDFQSVDRYKAAGRSAEAQALSEDATRLQAELGVRSAYFTAQAQRALVEVAQSTLDNQEKHLAQVEGFVRIGSRPEIDLAQARADRANAKVQLVNAQNAYDLARAQLNQAMGVSGPADFEVTRETLAPVPNEDARTEELVSEAVSTRPELRVYQKQLQAQELTLRATKGGYLPSLSTGLSFSDAGREIDNMAWNLGGSVSLSWNLFSGGATRAAVREQNANLAALDAQREGELLQVRVEVEQARLAVKAGKETLAAAGEALLAADDRLRLAEGRYRTGVGSILELSDAQLAQTSAAAQQVQSEYTLSTARAQLLHAIGRK